MNRKFYLFILFLIGTFILSTNVFSQVDCKNFDNAPGKCDGQKNICQYDYVSRLCNPIKVNPKTNTGKPTSSGQNNQKKGSGQKPVVSSSGSCTSTDITTCVKDARCSFEYKGGTCTDITELSYRGNTKADQLAKAVKIFNANNFDNNEKNTRLENECPYVYGRLVAGRKKDEINAYKVSESSHFEADFKSVLQNSGVETGNLNWNSTAYDMNAKTNNPNNVGGGAGEQTGGDKQGKGDGDEGEGEGNGDEGNGDKGDKGQTEPGTPSYTLDFSDPTDITKKDYCWKIEKSQDCELAKAFSSKSKCTTQNGPNKTLCELYKNKYEACIKNAGDDATKIEACLQKVCYWIPTDVSKPEDGKCVPLEDVVMPTLVDYPPQVIINVPAYTGNSEKETISKLIKEFERETEKHDFYFNTSTFGRLPLKEKDFLKISCTDVNSVIAGVYNSFANVKNREDCTLRLVGPLNDMYYAYDNNLLGFIPLVKNGNVYNYAPEVATSGKKIKPPKRSSDFCTTIKSQKIITPEALSAWAILRYSDFFSKGDLAISGKEFPSSLAQLSTIRNECNDQDRIVKDWATDEVKVLKDYQKEKKTGYFVNSYLHAAICTRQNMIPKVYLDKLKGINLDQNSSLCKVTLKTGQNTHIIDKIDSFFLNSLNAVESSLALGLSDEQLTHYYSNVAIISGDSGVISDVEKLTGQKDLGTKSGTKTKVKCGDDKKTMGGQFLCDLVTPDALSGLIGKGVEIWNAYEQAVQWQQQLALQKMMFEEGQCYPYKKDHEKASPAFCTATPDDPACMKIPFTVGGESKLFDMYQFCRLTASGALQFMDTCGSLVANKAPQSAIDACYGVQARQRGAFAPQYDKQSAAAVAAAGNNNNAAAEEKKKDDAAAAATTAGAAAGGAATPAATDKEKKTKYPFDNTYPSQYQGASPSRFSDRNYPYTQYDQGAAKEGTASPNKSFRSIKEASGPTIQNLIDGQVKVIRDNAGEK